MRALVEWPAGLGDMEEFHSVGMRGGQSRTPSFFAWSIDNKQDALAAAKVSGNNTSNAPYQYAAVMDLYFAAAFLPDSPEDTTVVTLHNSIALPVDPSDPNSKQQTADVLGIAVGSTDGATRLRIFAGPKASEVLASVHAMGPSGRADGPSLESLIQFGSGWELSPSRFTSCCASLCTTASPTGAGPLLSSLRRSRCSCCQPAS